MKKRPVGISIPAILNVTGCLGTFAVQILFSGVLSRVSESLGVSTLLTMVHLAFLDALGVAAGIGMWTGRKWAWWLGVLLLSYVIARNTNALFVISDVVREYGEPEAGATRFYVKHVGRIIVNSLVILYFFKSNVVGYFQVAGIRTRKRFLVVVGTPIGIVAIFAVGPLLGSAAGISTAPPPPTPAAAATPTPTQSVPTPTPTSLPPPSVAPAAPVPPATPTLVSVATAIPPTPTPTPTLTPTPPPTGTLAIVGDTSDVEVMSTGYAGDAAMGQMVVGDTGGDVPNLGRRALLRFFLSGLPKRIQSAVLIITLSQSRKDQYPAPGIVDESPPFTNPGLGDTIVVHVDYGTPGGGAYAAPSIVNDPGVLIPAGVEPGSVVSIDVTQALQHALDAGSPLVAFRIQTAIETDGDGLNDV